MDKLLTEMSEIRQKYSCTPCSRLSVITFFTSQRSLCEDETGTKGSSHLAVKQGQGSLITDWNKTIMDVETFSTRGALEDAG